MTDYPKVSVVTITYGHENYITQTLDGVLMQDYPGEIEFIIANDNSPDASDEVIKNYFKENPAPENFEIKYSRHSKNKGMMPNFIWSLEHATGKYIALCEGDDYWINPKKLQKQVDFLEKNEKYAMCFHEAKNYTQTLGLFSNRPPLESREYIGEEFLRTWLIHTGSVIFRSRYFDKEVRDRILHPKYIFGDIVLFLSIANKGEVYCLNDIMSVYRIHDSSMMRTLGMDIEGAMRYIDHHKHMATDFGGKYRNINLLIIADRYYRFFMEEKKKTIRISYFFKYNLLLFKNSKKIFFSKNNIKTILYHVFKKPF